ncbi:unnamed protein product [Litomosoides sigmodontis]|uniref:Uncharacterized protein n=1 Tax=Litomosoides sigmodontis TaxID=42156 RepID=A0A3P6SCE6_LITSI|nr:unnamed protein product [Litomosoides sigmodontis]
MHRLTMTTGVDQFLIDIGRNSLKSNKTIVFAENRNKTLTTRGSSLLISTKERSIKEIVDTDCRACIYSHHQILTSFHWWKAKVMPLIFKEHWKLAC